MTWTAPWLQIPEFLNFAAKHHTFDNRIEKMVEAVPVEIMRDEHLDLAAELQGVLGGGEARSSALSGIKGLLLAVLEDGIRSYLSPIKEVRAEAEYWVTSGRVRSPFCFVVICETLGLEPSAVRAALERMRAQRVNPTRAIGRTRPNVRRAHRVTQRQVG